MTRAFVTPFSTRSCLMRMPAKLRRFQFWLGSPRGALVYFGTAYTVLFGGYLIWLWRFM